MKKLISGFIALFLCLIAFSVFAGTILVFPKFQAFDSSGDMLSGGKVYTYEPGTTTPKTTYSDISLTTANTNPVILDAQGSAEIYFSGTLKVVLHDSSDSLQWTIDNLVGIGENIVSGITGYFAYYATPSSVSGMQYFSPAYLMPDSSVTNPINSSSVTASVVRSGASLIVDPTSGATLSNDYIGTIIRHDSANWDWFALPPVSGTTVIYYKFWEGTAGSGMTIQCADTQPFLGNGLSGTSVLFLPPGNQFQTCTIYGLSSGTSKYWAVEATASWDVTD